MNPVPAENLIQEELNLEEVLAEMAATYREEEFNSRQYSFRDLVRRDVWGVSAEQQDTSFSREKDGEQARALTDIIYKFRSQQPITGKDKEVIQDRLIVLDIREGSLAENAARRIDQITDHVAQNIAVAAGVRKESEKEAIAIDAAIPDKIAVFEQESDIEVERLKAEFAADIDAAIASVEESLKWYKSGKLDAIPPLIRPSAVLPRGTVARRLSDKAAEARTLELTLEELKAKKDQEKAIGAEEITEKQHAEARQIRDAARDVEQESNERTQEWARNAIAVLQAPLYALQRERDVLTTILNAPSQIAFIEGASVQPATKQRGKKSRNEPTAYRVDGQPGKSEGGVRRRRMLVGGVAVLVAVAFVGSGAALGIKKLDLDGGQSVEADSYPGDYYEPNAENYGKAPEWAPPVLRAWEDRIYEAVNDPRIAVGIDNDKNPDTPPVTVNPLSGENPVIDARFAYSLAAVATQGDSKYLEGSIFNVDPATFTVQDVETGLTPLVATGLTEEEKAADQYKDGIYVGLRSINTVAGNLMVDPAKKAVYEQEIADGSPSETLAKELAEIMGIKDENNRNLMAVMSTGSMTEAKAALKSLQEKDNFANDFKAAETNLKADGFFD